VHLLRAGENPRLLDTKMHRRHQSDANFIEFSHGLAANYHIFPRAMTLTANYAIKMERSRRGPHDIKI
jgi:hypothetical protein